MSVLVAARMRTSTLIVWVPPSRMNSFSCMTRSSLACVSRLMEEISSKKMVPLSAASNRPFFKATAPVKAPLTCPNRWLSSRSGGREPLLTVTNGASARFEFMWMARATSSLPVPLSPWRRIVLRVGAAARTRSKTFFMASLLPMMLSKPKRWRSSPLSRTFSSWRRLRSTAFSMTRSRSSCLKGFWT